MCCTWQRRLHTHLGAAPCQPLTPNTSADHRCTNVLSHVYIRGDSLRFLPCLLRAIPRYTVHTLCPRSSPLPFSAAMPSRWTATGPCGVRTADEQMRACRNGMLPCPEPTSSAADHYHVSHGSRFASGMYRRSGTRNCRRYADRALHIIQGTLTEQTAARAAAGSQAAGSGGGGGGSILTSMFGRSGPPPVAAYAAPEAAITSTADEPQVRSS